MAGGMHFSLFRGWRERLSRPEPVPAPLAAAPMRPVAPGVDGALMEIPGVVEPMIAAFCANGIRTVEDLAACATDDLMGWTEQSGGKTTFHPGILGDVVLSRQQCDAIILQARIRAGWIEART